jgi:hypothetical protein
MHKTIGKVMKYFFVIFGSLFTAFAQAEVPETVTGKISKVRTISDFHSKVSARQEVMFMIDTGHASGCTWLGIGKENDTFVSFILSAKAANQLVKVWYYSDLRTNSGSSVCQAYTVELQ